MPLHVILFMIKYNMVSNKKKCDSPGNLTYLYRYRIADVWGQELKHLKIAA